MMKMTSETTIPPAPAPIQGDAAEAVAKAELMERLEEIFVEDVPNKFVWKTHETQDEWIRGKLLPALRDCRAALTAADDRVAEVARERDEAREYGKQARLRENAAEDARIHEHDLRVAVEAKAAAQADYEARIRSTLTHPAPNNRNEVLEEAASVADKMKEVIPMWERPGDPPGNGPKRPALPNEIAAAIRALKEHR